MNNLPMGGLYGLSASRLPIPQQQSPDMPMQGLLPMLLQGKDGGVDLGQAKKLSLLAMLLSG